MTNNKIKEVNELIAGRSVEESLRLLSEKYNGKIAFSTSFGWEDQVITHLIFTSNLPVKVFTLDTGRMFNETYMVWSRTNEIYNQKIESYFPKPDAVQEMQNKKGPFS